MDSNLIFDTPTDQHLVEVPYNRIELHNLVPLIHRLDDEQCIELERDLQEVIDIWCRFLGIPLEDEDEGDIYA